MKNIIVSVIAILLMMFTACDNSLQSNINQEKWSLISKSPAAGFYQAFCFTDLNKGWAVGDSGRIINTNNSGNSWTVQNSGITSYLKCVCFTDSLNGWIGGGYNSIGITTNGGTSWTWQHPSGEPNRTFMTVSFINNNTGWIADNFGGILHTTDGGITWREQTSGTNWAITSIQFLDSNEGWAAATNRVVLHTTDGGDNWNVNILDSLNYKVTIVFQDIYFYNHTKGWIATMANLSSIANPIVPIIQTSNGGNNWNYTSTTNHTNWINALQFVNEDIGWAACGNGILYTENGGNTWEYQLEKNDGIFIDICFIDKTHGWALTFRGDIYRYRPL